MSTITFKDKDGVLYKVPHMASSGNERPVLLVDGKEDDKMVTKIFEIYIHKSYIPQNEAKNVYNKDSKRKSFILLENRVVFDIFNFFFSFTKVSNTNSKNEFSRTIQT